MADPWLWWPSERIATATQCPVDAVREHWPLLVDALNDRGIYERDIARAVIGTVAIETASTFRPVMEAYWLPERWRKENLPYYPYFGRGHIQLTHESGYRAAGEALGIDLLGNPDRALDPNVSARVLAWFWSTKGVPSKDGSRWYSLPDLCRSRDWEWVRRVVQGGTNGLDRLVTIANDLGGETTVPSPTGFNPNFPTQTQRNPWTCAIRTTMMLLDSIGIEVTPDEAQDTMSPRYVTPELGLLDASGAGVVEYLRDQWGVGAVNDAAATFDEVAALAGRQPVMFGLRNWGGPGKGHWSAVRGFDGTRLILANPGGTGPTFGQQTMTRPEFDARGPGSLVTIPLGTEPTPVPTRASVLVDEIKARLDELAALVRA